MPEDSKSRFSPGSRHSKVPVRETNATSNPLADCQDPPESLVQIAGPQSPKSTCLTFEVDVLPVPIWSENPSSDAKSGNWVGIDVGIC